MKTILQFLLLLLCAFSCTSQTNVSGGIYASTIWTAANSPYIVVDTVVVFPGVTLTIEPGVEIRFNDSMELDVRQANLIATGTITDSITFTSNSVTPSQGIWKGIYLHECPNSIFNFCKVKYADKGIYSTQDALYYDTLIVKNSDFNLNYCGVTNFWSHGINQFDSCSFLNNYFGMRNEYQPQLVSVNYCDFSYNQFCACLGGNLNHCLLSYNSAFTSDMVSYNHCTLTHNFRGPERGTIKNSVVSDNTYGLGFPPNRGGPSVDSCIIVNNQFGIFGAAFVTNSRIDSNSVLGIQYCSDIINCQVRFNGTGIDQIDSLGGINLHATLAYNIIENNDTGIILRSSPDIFCNRICNNIAYDLVYVNNSNVDVRNNYWCTADSLSTLSVIYDGYDNANYGLVVFMPIDTMNCYLAVATNEIARSVSPAVYVTPNPFSDCAIVTFQNPEQKNFQAKVFNSYGNLLYRIEKIPGNQIRLEKGNLSSGFYFLQLITDNHVSSVTKFVVID